MIDEAIAELAPLVGTRQACQATGRPQANHYRRHRQSPPPPRPVRERRPQPRALSQAERDTVRALLNSPDFVDKAPAGRTCVAETVIARSNTPSAGSDSTNCTGPPAVNANRSYVRATYGLFHTRDRHCCIEPTPPPPAGHHQQWDRPTALGSRPHYGGLQLANRATSVARHASGTTNPAHN